MRGGLWEGVSEGFPPGKVGFLVNVVLNTCGADWNLYPGLSKLS